MFTNRELVGVRKSMFRYVIFLYFLLSALCSYAETKQKLALEGLIPGQYVSSPKGVYVKGAIVIDRTTRLIEAIETSQDRIEALQRNENVDFLSLKRGSRWDVMYPGLIDLHNHTKQNNLGVWSEAKGQFANRFEWRGWSPYKKSVSGNMNPWIGYGPAVNCAAFRWSEIQAMAVGTTYLQGPSSCIENFAIHRVEDRNAFVSSKMNVQAPTDLIIPGDMVFVWNTLGPIIREIQNKNQLNPESESYRLAYEEAFAQVVNQYCDFGSKGIIIDKYTVRGEALSHLKDKALLTEVCQTELPSKFIRYVYWVHKSIIGKKLYAESIGRGEGAAIIAHLAEGRRDDEYNQKEFELVKLLGMDQKHVNFVHGVGINDSGLKTMGEKKMGLIWSPYSNLLLYNQTLDLKKALEHKVLVALGSDWLPTGSKGPLEEFKIARNYVLKKGLQKTLESIPGVESFDEALFKMATEFPAKMINHWQSGADSSQWQNGEWVGGIGTLTKGAMGSLIVTSKKHENPYTNLVKEVWETDINLVVVDGHIQYGNQSYLDQFYLSYESLPNGEHNMELLHEESVPFLLGPQDKQRKLAFLVELSQIITAYADSMVLANSCKFEEYKGFVHQNTSLIDSKVLDFKDSSGLNLDRFRDIQRLIGINLMTQSRNRNDPEEGDPDYQVKDFTPLYTCNDSRHYNRLINFVNPDPSATTDEMSVNEASRQGLIQEQGLGQKPQRMSEKYPSH